MKRKDAKLIRNRLALIVRKAIERVGKKKSQIAQEAGISPLTLSKILSGHGNPSEETIRALGKALWDDEEHIQKDKIMQRIRDPKEEKPSVFALNLGRLLEERKITQADFARQVGVTPTVVSHWLKAGCSKGAFPKEPNMVKISKIFGLSASKLKSPRLFAKKAESDEKEEVASEGVCPEMHDAEQEKVSLEGQDVISEDESALDWEARCKVLEAEVAQLKQKLAGKSVDEKAVAPELASIPVLLRGVVSEIVNAVLDVVEQRKQS